MANEHARALRKRMTPWEARLWVHLRALRTKGWHFRRQAPIGRYIVDFACLKSMLVVELDGEEHRQIVDEDRARDVALGELGYRVLRFWNGELTRDVEGVLATILSTLEQR